MDRRLAIGCKMDWVECTVCFKQYNEKKLMVDEKLEGCRLMFFSIYGIIDTLQKVNKLTWINEYD